MLDTKGKSANMYLKQKKNKKLKTESKKKYKKQKSNRMI
jgi:hypothetical protein